MCHILGHNLTIVMKEIRSDTASTKHISAAIAEEIPTESFITIIVSIHQIALAVSDFATSHTAFSINNTPKPTTKKK